VAIMIWPVCLGLLGAAFLGGGFVIQQREAAHSDPGSGLSLRLLGQLMHRRIWWVGVASMVVGYVLAGWSLGSGNLVLVEPLIAANMLFALPIAAMWCRKRPSWRSMVAAFALAGGVSGFVLAARPNGGRSVSIPANTWAAAGMAAAIVVAAMTVMALRRRGNRRAGWLGAATGIVYGMQDSLTRRVYGGIAHSAVDLLTSWPIWVLVGVGFLGVLLAQIAFDCAPLSASLPAISVLEPMTGIALGILVFHSHIRTDTFSLAMAALSLLVMLGGAFAVSRSHVVEDMTTAPVPAPAA
jgi:drug/metabolite transporter (DMT)-like permease